jgi:hypothetical protein
MNEMSKMSGLSIEIQEMLQDGVDVTTIAHKLSCPLDWVIREADALEGDYSADDGQPDEYTEWQDLYGGDDFAQQWDADWEG